MCTGLILYISGCQITDQSVDKIINKLIIIVVLSNTITIVHIQPRDPCPAYPVTSYIFNISDDNGNFIDTISHMGNTSITINGSDYDLGHDQVYRLIVEAINDAGSTPSEEILLCKSNMLLQYYFVFSII